MPGGPGQINEYNKSLSAEERKASAKKAGKQSGRKRKQAKLLREYALAINNAPAPAEAREGLARLGIKEKDMTNAALIVAGVYRQAYKGDMRAVEKWERYIGQVDENEARRDGMLADLIDGLLTPYSNDLYTETEGLDGPLATEPAPKD
jgi:hypothetical protein